MIVAFISGEVREVVKDLRRMENDYVLTVKENREAAQTTGGPMASEIRALMLEMRTVLLKSCGDAVLMARGLEGLDRSIEAELLMAAAERVRMTVNAA